MNELLDSVDDFKTKLQKQKFNLFGLAAGLFVVAIRLADVTINQNAKPYEVIVSLSLSLIVTLLLWNNYYASGKLSAKDMEGYKALNAEIDAIVDAVLKSPQAKDGDEWCEKFADLELHNAQFKVISRVRLDFKVFEEKYSVMSRRDIKALADPELAKPLTSKQVKAILKAARMKPITDVTFDNLLNEQGGSNERYTIGDSEASLQVKSTRRKGAKVIAFGLLTTYFGWKLTQSPTWDMVLEVLISCMPYVATIIFAWKSGYEDVHDKLHRRNQNRKRLLLQFCDDKGIKQTPPPN